MKRILFPLLLILTLALLGAEAPADDPDPGGDPAPADGAPQASESQPAGEPPSEEPPETFVPSEKLPADSAISFPVDI